MSGCVQTRGSSLHSTRLFTTTQHSYSLPLVHEIVAEALAICALLDALDHRLHLYWRKGGKVALGRPADEPERCLHLLGIHLRVRGGNVALTCGVLIGVVKDVVQVVYLGEDGSACGCVCVTMLVLISSTDCSSALRFMNNST